MKKCIIISALVLGLLGSVFAQDGGFGPAAGDFSGAVLFGRGNFLTTGLDIPGVAGYSGSSWSVSGSAPYLNIVEANYNDVSNMVGVEGRYFFSDKVALKISGGAILRNTPPIVNIPGYTPSSTPISVWIPAYNAVEQKSNVDMNINIGGDYFFPSSKFERVFPYVGANIPFFYGRRSAYDPTIQDVNGIPTIVDIGLRHVEMIGFGLQSVAGIDYYLAEGLYFGFEFKPVSYVYAFNRKSPGPGLDIWEAETHTWTFFSQVFFKLGFRF
jgi:hypothetical protein